MVKTVVDPAFQNRPDLKSKIHQATELLDGQMGPSASRSTAEWILTQDFQSRDVIELRVSDWTGTVGYRFAPDELEDAEHMEHRLHRLWGDLLMVRSHVQMDGHLGPYSGPSHP